MAEELRNVYNLAFTDKLLAAISQEYTLFESEQCNKLIYQEDWQDLALKERMRRITVSLYATLPKEYPIALAILYNVAPKFSGSLSGIIFPDYVEQYGLDSWKESIEALAYFTQFSTSEFAVRPFLLKNKHKMLKQMLDWSVHPNEHVRRLASEGSRPRLPWGLSVPSLKENPEQTLAILTNLKEDDSLYVRKSVANHLNDISYYKPDIVLHLAKDWLGQHKHTDWIIKHACRSLLKKGDPRALQLFGYKDEQEIEVRDFSLYRKQIRIGDSLSFACTIISKKEMPVRVEYAIDYVKAKGHRTRKVFMISTTNMGKNETKTFEKQQTFKNLTTRKHYPGTHTLSVIINGTIKASLDFEVRETEAVEGTK